MKCLQCHRRVKDTMESKVKHIWKYHPDVVTANFARWFDTGKFDELLYRLGECFGTYIKTKIQSRIGTRV